MDLPGAARKLCDRCLGRRRIGAAGEVPQQEAGRQARLSAAGLEIEEARCAVCEGAFADLAQWVEAAITASRPYSFATFQAGTRFPSECEAFERQVSQQMGQEKVGETIRTEANRLLAKEFAGRTGAAVVGEGGRPDLVLSVDTRFWSCDVEAAPVFVRGRYNKLRRDIPQTHWPCRRCEGRGCWQCNDTGVTYAESVEDAIGEPAQPLFGATGFAFHGAGREDIDALMLGTGRPFILELKAPRYRSAELGELEARINAETGTSGVAVRDLRMATRDDVVAIKEGEYDKEYLAHCLTGAPVTRAAVEGACAAMTGVTLEQRTPERVSHRRADLVRKRTVHRLALDEMGEDPGVRFSIRVLAESGTYIKEMVNGDDGRTTPSLSGLLGQPAKVEFLDVVAILDDQPKTVAAAPDHGPSAGQPL